MILKTEKYLNVYVLEMYTFVLQWFKIHYTNMLFLIKF